MSQVWWSFFEAKTFVPVLLLAWTEVMVKLADIQLHFTSHFLAKLLVFYSFITACKHPLRISATNSFSYIHERYHTYSCSKCSINMIRSHDDAVSLRPLARVLFPNTVPFNKKKKKRICWQQQSISCITGNRGSSLGTVIQKHRLLWLCACWWHKY